MILRIIERPGKKKERHELLFKILNSGKFSKQFFHFDLTTKVLFFNPNSPAFTISVRGQAPTNSQWIFLAVDCEFLSIRLHQAAQLSLT